MTTTRDLLGTLENFVACPVFQGSFWLTAPFETFK